MITGLKAPLLFLVPLLLFVSFFSPFVGNIFLVVPFKVAMCSKFANAFCTHTEHTLIDRIAYSVSKLNAVTIYVVFANNFFTESMGVNYVI